MTQLISIPEIKSLRNVVRGLISAALNEITATADYKTLTPFKQKLSIAGHQITASFSLIQFDEKAAAAGYTHTCQKPKVAILDIGVATDVPFQIGIEAEDFGKPVSDEDVDSLTDSYMDYALHAAADRYIIDSGIAQEITTNLSEAQFGRLEQQSSNLIQVGFTDNSHHLTYKDPKGAILFKMEYDDGIFLYNLAPEFHLRAIASNYVRCYLHAITAGYLHADAKLTLSEPATAE